MSGLKGWVLLSSLLGLLVSCQALVVVEVGKGFDAERDTLAWQTGSLAQGSAEAMDAGRVSDELSNTIHVQRVQPVSPVVGSKEPIQIASMPPCNSQQATAKDTAVKRERRVVEPVPQQPDGPTRCAKTPGPVTSRPC